MKRLFVAAAAAASLILLTTAAGPGTAASTPSGQRSLGQSVLEPVYNDENAGQIGYIKQPEHVARRSTRTRRRGHPSSTWSSIRWGQRLQRRTVHALAGGQLPHSRAGNRCLAAATYPTVYGAGVIGHDHLMDFPGGSDFTSPWSRRSCCLHRKVRPMARSTSTSSRTRRSTRWSRVAMRSCSRARRGPLSVPRCRRGSTTWQRR
jgi:hypothetical protein